MNTLSYYNQNADAFIEGTQNADMTRQYRFFFKHASQVDKLLDLGCGSGILGLAAAKLGASDVLAIDLDESAVKVAKENNLDFLFLVPAEDSLFDYYAKCGFQKFGISRHHTLKDTPPIKKDKLKYEYEMEFSESVLKHWKKACVVYGGKVTDFGLVFDDEETVIRNAQGNYHDIPEEYKKTGVKVMGNINFGESYTPAMIKTENKTIKNTDCYIGITLE